MPESMWLEGNEMIYGMRSQRFKLLNLSGTNSAWE
jgi:hypothetical protein